MATPMLLLVAAFFSLAVVGVLDYLTGYQISFGVFYLAPVGIAAWYAGKYWGLALSLLASLTWYAVELLAGHPYDHPLIPVWNAYVRFMFFLVTSLLLSELRARLVHEIRLARTDNLTGLFNSRAFRERLEHDLAVNARTGGSLTVVYIDLDDFKAVNDEGGHLAGDRQLQRVASRMSRAIRHSDTAGRLGGDEFALILPATDAAGAGVLLEKLVAELARPSKDGRPVQCSIGALTIGRGEPSADDVIKAADDLMYTAKQAGKNRYVLKAYAEA